MGKLLENLRELRCTVIILSATLTAQKRCELLRHAEVSPLYPLISAVARPLPRGEVSGAAPDAAFPQETLRERSFDGGMCKKVSLLKTERRGEAMEEAVLRAERGEQILWIENTVKEAQESYIQLRSKAGNIPCGLLHARFLQRDRLKLEEIWTDLYGKRDVTERSQSGHLLVGTQVLEQSLDIDADCLFTALCPMDMLLQRLGRLWRHDRLGRPASACCRAWILLPESGNGGLTSKIFGASGKVYAPYILARTLERLQAAASLELPGEIRPLLEAVYAERREDGLLAQWKHEMESQAGSLIRRARMAGADLGQGMSDERGGLGTRYSEQETCTVLLAARIDQAKGELRLHWPEGGELPLPSKIDRGRGQEWRNRAAALLRHTVRVPEYLAPQGRLQPLTAACLKLYVFLGDVETPLFRIAKRENSDLLRNLDGSPAREDYELSYTEHLGYVARKNNN
jgi:CRISPR-associated endonuclease/helicase Cas3